MAKTTEKIDCPRCSGTGIYQGFGVCFRCRGRKKVNPAPVARQKAALPAPKSAEELAERADIPLADAEAIFNYSWDD